MHTKVKALRLSLRCSTSRSGSAKKSDPNGPSVLNTGKVNVVPGARADPDDRGKEDVMVVQQEKEDQGAMVDQGTKADQDAMVTPDVTMAQDVTMVQDVTMAQGVTVVRDAMVAQGATVGQDAMVGQDVTVGKDVTVVQIGRVDPETNKKDKSDNPSPNPAR